MRNLCKLYSVSKESTKIRLTHVLCEKNMVEKLNLQDHNKGSLISKIVKQNTNGYCSFQLSKSILRIWTSFDKLEQDPIPEIQEKKRLNILSGS